MNNNYLDLFLRKTPAALMNYHRAGVVKETSEPKRRLAELAEMFFVLVVFYYLYYAIV